MIKKDKFWWRDKTLKLKIKSDNIGNFEKQLKNLYGFSNIYEFNATKTVQVKYGVKTQRGTFVVDTEGNLSRIYEMFLEMGGFR